MADISQADVATALGLDVAQLDRVLGYLVASGAEAQVKGARDSLVAAIGGATTAGEEHLATVTSEVAKVAAAVSAARVGAKDRETVEAEAAAAGAAIAEALGAYGQALVDIATGLAG